MSELLRQLSDATTKLVDAARAGVVCVGAGKARPRTGLVVAEGEVVTLAMVAEPGEEVPVHGPDGEITATVVGFDEASGIALLKAPGLSVAATIADAAPAVGALGVTVACPIPSGHEARLSMIRCVGGPTRVRGGRRVSSYLQTDSARFSGFAAAVLFDADACALGITMPTRRREEAYVLPMSEVMSIVEQLRSGKSVGSAYLGVQTTPVELPAAADGATHGLLVSGVEHGSPAAEAGIQVGRFLVAVGGEPTTNLEELYDALVGKRDGDTLDLKVADADGNASQVTVRVVLRR